MCEKRPKQFSQASSLWWINSDEVAQKANATSQVTWIEFLCLDWMSIPDLALCDQWQLFPKCLLEDIPCWMGAWCSYVFGNHFILGSPPGDVQTSQHSKGDGTCCNRGLPEVFYQEMLWVFCFVSVWHLLTIRLCFRIGWSTMNNSWHELYLCIFVLLSKYHRAEHTTGTQGIPVEWMSKNIPNTTVTQTLQITSCKRRTGTWDTCRGELTGWQVWNLG